MHRKRNGELLSAKGRSHSSRRHAELAVFRGPVLGRSAGPMIYAGRNPRSNDPDLDPEELDYQLSEQRRAAAAGDDSLRSRDSARYIPNERREASRPPRDLT